VAEPWLPSLDFQAYLEAKAPIDSGSLDPGLFARFRRSFEGEREPRLLDLGTGTGAMLRRVLALRPAGPMELAGLDSEARSLEQARRCIAEQLREQGCRLREQTETAGWCLEAESGTRRVRVRLLRGNLLDPGAAAVFPKAGFGFLTAHAFLDLLPLERALRIMHPLLAPGGLLYSTLNYDGSTALLPPDRDPGFEQALLAAYDHSMETRCVGGLPTGGAFSGRLAPGTAFFLQALLGMIAGEGLRAPGIDPEELEAWWRRRSADIRAGRLGLRARNQDLLAQRS
jgi:SAM-dependent methyltransferase